MITREQHAHIRRLYFAEHWKVGTIAKELGLHPHTVERAVEIERFGARIEAPRPSALDPYKPFVLLTLDKHPSRMWKVGRSRDAPDGHRRRGCVPGSFRYRAVLGPLRSA